MIPPNGTMALRNVSASLLIPTKTTACPLFLVYLCEILMPVDYDLVLIYAITLIKEIRIENNLYFKTWTRLQSHN